MISTLFLMCAFQTPTEGERPLMVGDPAPAIRVAEWVQGTPVERFAPGQVYVVEFWATWCGPCKEAIPHLNELQKKYGESVRFIGVSVWERISAEEPYSVPAFVKKMGEKMTYTVAADCVREDDAPHMAPTWMEAAGQNGIPAAFIVDQQGRIAWIGYPPKIDKPLAEIVAGTWDLAAATAKHAQELETKGVTMKVTKEITKAKKQKDWEAGIRAIEAAVAQTPALEANFGVEKYFLLLEAQRVPDAASYGQRLVSSVLAQNAMALNTLAWTIVDPQGSQSKSKHADFKLAVSAAERAVELTQAKEASTLDTLALALFRTGDVARAIELQTKAVELAKGQQFEKELTNRLEEFRAARAKSGL